MANAPDHRPGHRASTLTAAGAVLIDLTAVSFLDSAGVRLLDALVGDLDEHGHADPASWSASAAPARMTLQLCAFRDDLLATDLDRAAAELRSSSPRTLEPHERHVPSSRSSSSCCPGSASRSSTWAASSAPSSRTGTPPPCAGR